MRFVLSFIIIFYYSLAYNQNCNIKTNKRPDGVTVEYFNPKLVYFSSDFEVGLSLAKANNIISLSVSTRYTGLKQQELLSEFNIRLKNGTTLKPDFYTSRNTYINGESANITIFTLNNKEQKLLRNNIINGLTINFEYNGMYYISLTNNNSVIVNQIKCFSKGENKKNSTPRESSTITTYKPNRPLSNSYTNKVDMYCREFKEIKLGQKFSSFNNSYLKYSKSIKDLYIYDYNNDLIKTIYGYPIIKKSLYFTIEKQTLSAYRLTTSRLAAPESESGKYLDMGMSEFEILQNRITEKIGKPTEIFYPEDIESFITVTWKGTNTYLTLTLNYYGVDVGSVAQILVMDISDFDKQNDGF